MPARERRLILRSLFTPGSVKWCSLKTDTARLVYLILVVNADDNGRVECGWREVAALAPLWKVKQNEIIGTVRDLEGVGLIRKYGVDKYGNFLGWSEKSISKLEDPGEVAARYGFCVNSLPCRYQLAPNSVATRSYVAADFLISEATRKYIVKWCCVINGFVESQSSKEVKWENEPITKAAESGPKIAYSSLHTNNTYKEEKSATVCDSKSGEQAFAEARRKYRRIVGKNLGTLGARSREWNGFVESVGAEMALAAIELWARESKDYLKTFPNPLALFLKNKATHVDDVTIERERAVNPEEKDGDDSSDVTVEDIRPPGYVPPKKERVQRCSK